MHIEANPLKKVSGEQETAGEQHGNPTGRASKKDGAGGAEAGLRGRN